MVAHLLLKSMHSREIVGDGTQTGANVAAYELICETDKTEEGEVYIPDRICDSYRSRVPVCVMYMGMKPSTTSHKYHDVRIIESEENYSIKHSTSTFIDDDITMEAWSTVTNAPDKID